MKQDKIAPVIFLNTGRCGSTMMSEMMSRHPRILSLSEFFFALGTNGFAKDRLDGEAMWKMCSRQSPFFAKMMELMSRHGMPSEVLYPFDDPQARFSLQNIPPIMLTTLPHLTPNFESLYDELEPIVRARPDENLADQYRFLFGWLGERFGRDMWVERSGGSLLKGLRLLNLFPEARMVHLYRDGRDTAMSMSRHLPFQIAQAVRHKALRLGIERYKPASIDTPTPPISAFSLFLEKAFFSVVNIEKMISREFDLAAYGELWSRIILVGQAYLSSLPPERFLALGYEDILERPYEKMKELIEFIDPSLADEAWLDEVAQIPRPTKPKYLALEPEVQERLTRACAPGLEALGYALD